jgi:UDP-N-acetyl-D-glucosamine/UDP-N-acetyl-D-galactosamine dehydrogenase
MINQPGQRRIAVIGLGYVGLPVALAMAKRFPGTVGFDTNEAKVKHLGDGDDRNGEVSRGELAASSLQMTSQVADIADANFYIVAVPTPIDRAKHPDLGALRTASRTVGGALKRGDIVVFESTVYPGVTEEVCGPILAETSGLRCGVDFTLGYSPERINPGDLEHTFETIVKVVSGQDAATLAVVADVYGSVVTAGVHRASSIKVAEASKVIENIQRDLNIALMNELALIFDRLDIDTAEVLAASGTKWNFLRFAPGLVGGHCIGVDPYYLTSKAEEVGIHPQVILAGRRINDSMGTFVAQRTIKQLILAGRSIQGARVAVLGLAFKENVRDVRNSRVPDIVHELQDYGITVLVHDPLAYAEVAHEEYGIELVKETDLTDLDAVILAVPHRVLLPLAHVLARRPTPVVIDVRAALVPAELPIEVRYWRL